jgi:hypothetical protein
VVFIGNAQPRNPLHCWLKPTASADVAHYVVWQNGVELRTGCQTSMRVQTAVQARCGVRLCESCLDDLRSRNARNNRKKKR